ncbi:MAG TPA: non-heme iron oxygenase ferredoxin subunit [Mycobacteriales bacterium]|nr:non-heme iron oxygenase ferredoxin subunit [Mycobacteriales bacterium]
MSYVRACSLSELAEDSAKAVEIDGVAVCLARSQGEVTALLDECSHAEVALSDGEVADGTVECWLHGSRFDLRTGKPIGPPATEAVTTYPVRIDGDDVFVAVKE